MIQMPQLVDQSASFIPPQQFSGTVSAAIHSLVSRQTASTVVSVSKGKFFHFLAINRHEGIEYNLLNQLRLFSFGHLILLRFRCGMLRNGRLHLAEW